MTQRQLLITMWPWGNKNSNSVFKTFFIMAAKNWISAMECFGPTFSYWENVFYITCHYFINLYTVLYYLSKDPNMKNSKKCSHSNIEQTSMETDDPENSKSHNDAPAYSMGRRFQEKQGAETWHVGTIIASFYTPFVVWLVKAVN